MQEPGRARGRGLRNITSVLLPACSPRSEHTLNVPVTMSTSGGVVQLAVTVYTRGVIKRFESSFPGQQNNKQGCYGSVLTGAGRVLTCLQQYFFPHASLAMVAWDCSFPSCCCLLRYSWRCPCFSFMWKGHQSQEKCFLPGSAHWLAEHCSGCMSLSFTGRPARPTFSECASTTSRRNRQSAQVCVVVFEQAGFLYMYLNCGSTL